MTVYEPQGDWLIHFQYQQSSQPQRLAHHLESLHAEQAQLGLALKGASRWRA